MASILLATYYDPGLVVRDDTPADLERAEVERLRLLHAVASAAVEIPRRAGGDATGHELSADKKRCKRVAWVAVQCLRAWRIEATGVGPAVNSEAAQVRWDAWWEQHQVFLLNRTKYVATWGLGQQHPKEQFFAKAMITKLQNEERWLAYAMR